MSSSKALGSVVVGSERSEGWGAALFVVPAGGGEGEESLKDAGGDAGEAAGGCSSRSSCALRDALARPAKEWSTSMRSEKVAGCRTPPRMVFRRRGRRAPPPMA